MTNSYHNILQQTMKIGYAQDNKRQKYHTKMVKNRDFGMKSPIMNFSVSFLLFY